ncbi:unnamed protein product, partial [marine sediment metagenome]
STSRLRESLSLKTIEANRFVNGEDIEDIKDMEEELARYQSQPGSAIELEEYLSRKKACAQG